MNKKLFALALLLTSNALHADVIETDICVYGGTSGGVAAALQAKRMGKTVVVIEPTRRLGGLTTGGLGQTDIGNKAAIGGISREFYQRVRNYYEQPAAWKWQTRQQYEDSGQTRTAKGEDAMWTFEPGAALAIINDMIREADVNVVYGERLDRSSGVGKEGHRITFMTMESGRVFKARMFIDATYEGDLLAAAGVSHTVGREPNARYGETLNGVQTKNARFHQLLPGIDPYTRKGDPGSGLLPHIDPAGPGEEGAGDDRLQAYCFRMCLTDHPDNRIPFQKPAGYNELWYELLLRNFEAGEKGMPWINSSMPNRKTDTNNRLGFSTDFIGQNYRYPEASYSEREEIVARHRLYQQGLMWTLANHPRVPEQIRREFSRWGMSKDEFVEGGGWQEQLYIREARRMIGELVMTQHHCQGREVVTDPVGMAAYTMDSHNVQRYVDANGHVRNEGDVQVGGFPPYAISYRSIIPKAGECANLLVPVCLSASHIAFGSIRMEPVFMVLGQSAATAAALAIDDDVPVQQVNYSRLALQLIADKQVLTWVGGGSTEPADGIIVDNADASVTVMGEWGASAVIGGSWKGNYLHDRNEGKGAGSVTFKPNLPQAGAYQVYTRWTANANRATNVPVDVVHASGKSTVSVDQTKNGGTWFPLLTTNFNAGTNGHVVIRNANTAGYVVADAVRWVAVTNKAGRTTNGASIELPR